MGSNYCVVAALTNSYVSLALGSQRIGSHDVTSFFSQTPGHRACTAALTILRFMSIFILYLSEWSVYLLPDRRPPLGQCWHCRPQWPPLVYGFVRCILKTPHLERWLVRVKWRLETATTVTPLLHMNAFRNVKHVMCVAVFCCLVIKQK